MAQGRAKAMPTPKRSEFIAAFVVGLVVTGITVALGARGRPATSPGLVAAALTLLWLIWRRT